MANDELGTLVIVVLKAKDLNDKYFWKQDVFAQVGLNGETKRTKVDVKGGQHPMWDEEIRFPILKGSGDKFRKVEVSCWSKEPRKEDVIGQGFIDLEDGTLKSGEFDDWVKLEVNGVSRGEIYLEMTYFANAPAGVGPGLVVQPANLQRRPSKLNPAERLARPPYTAPPQRHPDSHGPPANGHGLSPPSSRGHSTSPPRTGRESPLPPIPPEQQQQQHPPKSLAVPGALTPGRPKPQGTPQHVPSILRPRNPKSSPTPIPGPAVEYTGVVPAPEQSAGHESPSRGYTSVVPAPDSSRYEQPLQPDYGSNDSPGGFSFPVPSIPGAREPTVEFSKSPPIPGGYSSPSPPLNRHGSGGSTSSFSPPPAQYQQQPPPSSFQSTPPPFQQPQTYQAPPQSYQPPPPTFQPPPPAFSPPPNSLHPQPPPANNHRNDLPDPYLLARYQSPLPLPPGAEKTPPARERSSSHAGRVPTPPPKGHTAQAQSNPDNARLQALQQVEDDTARRKAEDRERKEKEFAQMQALEEARWQREKKEREEREEKERMQKEVEEEARLRREQEREEKERAYKQAEEDARLRREQERKEKEEKERARKQAEEDARRRREQEERLRELKRVEEEAARRREQEKQDRELALKEYEQEKRRKEQEERDNELALQQFADEEKRQLEQEEKDRELARQLDRELNLSDQ